MTIPSLPSFYDMPLTDAGAKMSTEASLYNDNLWQSLNLAIRIINEVISTTISSATTLNTITIDTLKVPNKTTAQITVYRDDLEVPLGSVWYNTNLNKLQVKTDLGIPPGPGTIETIQSV